MPASPHQFSGTAAESIHAQGKAVRTESKAAQEKGIERRTFRVIGVGLHQSVNAP